MDGKEFIAHRWHCSFVPHHQKLFFKGPYCRLAKKLDMSERQVEDWLKQRSAASKTSKKLDKFCEQAWKSLYHTWTFCYSWVVLWDKKWFWSIKACWFDFPYHSVPDDIWWYYMIQLSAFWSLVITQFASYNSKRKDFKA